MSYHAIEGVDYIFDRYAFLNGIMAGTNQAERISPQSDIADIERVLRHARVAYHADKFARMGSDLKESAAHTVKLLTSCAEYLTDPILKALYDEKLAAFQQETPKLVSTSGTPIIDLSRPRFDLDSLLSADIPDTSAMEKAIKDMTGYDEGQFNQLRQIFQTMPENAQIRSLYRLSLTARFTYLTLLEDAAWAKVGYQTNGHAAINTMLHDTDDYAEVVENALRDAKTHKIETALQQRGGAALLGLTKLPLLLTDQTTSPTATTADGTYTLADPRLMQEALEKIKQKAQANFTVRAEYVRAAARLKQEALAELVTLNPVTTIHEKADDACYEIYLATAAPDDRVLLRMDFNVATNHATMNPFTPISKSDFMRTAFNHNAILVEHNSEISFTQAVAELTAVVKTILAKQEQAHPAIS